MRDIKFRAYIKDNIRVPNEKYKMVEVKSLHFGSRNAIIGYSKSKTNYGNYSISFDDIELMQFTGLYDKNGKEIYEGDIVEYSAQSSILNIKIRDVVEWVDDNGDIRCGYTPLGCHFYDNGFNGYDFEVIGNIYENPELLEVD